MKNNDIILDFKIYTEIYVLLTVLVVILVVVYVFKIDFYLADLIYNPYLGWQYKNAWFTSIFIHKVGKYILIFTYMLLWIEYLFRGRFNYSRENKFGFLVLLATLMLGSAIVGYLKQVLNVDCPWDLVRYGGEQTYHGVFIQGLSSHMGHCFPAGHSSAAFTWISLYFYCSIYLPKMRLKVLATVLVVGFIFGFSQQLRGAHFFSHDIYSLLVCLFANMVVYSLAFRHAPRKIMNIPQSLKTYQDLDNEMPTESAKATGVTVIP
jgi:membrane-associated PAP2 superfamily phosphatase